MKALFMKLIIGVLLAAILLQLYLIHKLHCDQSADDRYCHFTHDGINPPTSSMCDVTRRRPVLMIPQKGKTLTLVENVFTRLGYKIQHFSNHDNNDNNTIDVMWHHLYPYKELEILKMIQNVAKMNHYPGIGYLAAKSVLNTWNGGTKYTPKTFEMPKQKQQFLKEIEGPTGVIDENRVWIQKNLEHRGNIVKPVKELNLDKPGLIQEFVSNPFLLHGHVINIGINVIITSTLPLRAYVLDSAWLIRICNEPFHPIDYSDITKYVTDGDHMHRNLFEFKPMKRYFDAGYSRKQALFAYIRSELGKDPSPIEYQIYDAIQDTLIKRENRLLVSPTGKPFAPYSRFFEVMRWDFILDDDLGVHLIEANMSPDMSEVETLIRMKNEHLIYSTISTIGCLHGSGNKHGLRDGDTFVDLDICYTRICQENCHVQECDLCSSCISRGLGHMLQASFAEHTSRQGLRAVFPQPMTEIDAQSYDPIHDNHLTKHNQIHQAWLRAKCVDDVYWCT